MVRKLVELPKFFVFNSGTNSFGNSSIFTFYLLLFTLYRFLYLLLSFGCGVSDIFMSAFQMELDDYPHFDLRGREAVFHGPALLGVSESAI
jgi:hypothetical protein